MSYIESYDLGFQTCSYSCPGQEWNPGRQDPLESKRTGAAKDTAEQCWYAQISLVYFELPPPRRAQEVIHIWESKHYHLD